MTITIKITTDNAAFAPDPGPEVARILRIISDDLDWPPFERDDWNGYALRDINGNIVGSVRVTGR